MKPKNLKNIWYCGALIGLFLILLQAWGLFPLNSILIAFILIILSVLAFLDPFKIFYFFLFISPFWEFILTSSEIPVAIRPYQLTFLGLFIGIIARIVFKKEKLKQYKPKRQDLILTVPILLASIALLINSPDKIFSLKYLLSYSSLLIIYFICKKFFKQAGVLQRSIETLIFGSLIVSGFGSLEVLFIKFENIFAAPITFAGRPDSVLFEPDWLGFYNLFIIVLIGWLNLFPRSKKFPKGNIDNSLLKILLYINIFSLISSLARSSWLGLIFILINFFGFLLIRLFVKKYKPQWLKVNISNLDNLSIRKFFNSLMFTLLILILLVQNFDLSKMDLKDRFISIFGQEKITVAINPKTNKEYWINLENIDNYRNSGFIITEKYRKDVNVEQRAEKQESDLAILQEHPIMGGGFGYAELKKGNENSSMNIIFEILISTGILGLMTFSWYAGIIFMKLKTLFEKKSHLNLLWLFISFMALLIPNIFNNGFYMIFCWIWLAINTGFIDLLISSNKK